MIIRRSSPRSRAAAIAARTTTLAEPVAAVGRGGVDGLDLADPVEAEQLAGRGRLAVALGEEVARAASRAALSASESARSRASAAPIALAVPRLHQRAHGVEADLAHLARARAPRASAPRSAITTSRSAVQPAAVKPFASPSPPLGPAILRWRRPAGACSRSASAISASADSAGGVVDDEQVEVPLRRVRGREDRDAVRERLGPRGDALEVRPLVRPQARELSLRRRHRRRRAGSRSGPPRS